MYAYIYIYIHYSITYVYIYIYIYMSTYVYHNVCRHTYIYISLSIYLSLHIYIYIYIYTSIITTELAKLIAARLRILRARLAPACSTSTGPYFWMYHKDREGKPLKSDQCDEQERGETLAERGGDPWRTDVNETGKHEEAKQTWILCTSPPAGSKQWLPPVRNQANHDLRSAHRPSTVRVIVILMMIIMIIVINITIITLITMIIKGAPLPDSKQTDHFPMLVTPGLR